MHINDDGLRDTSAQPGERGDREWERQAVPGELGTARERHTGGVKEIKKISAVGEAGVAQPMHRAEYELRAQANGAVRVF